MDLPSFADTFAGFLFNEPAILKGESIEIVEWKTVLEKIIGELMKEPQSKDNLGNLMKSTSGDFPFLRYLFGNSTVKKMIGEYATKCKQQIKKVTSCGKNVNTATSIRLSGNSLFVKKEYRASFKMFTRGLMFVRDEDEETPLLYANRSAAYFYFKQYENALEDIERALKFGYGNLKPTGKLLIRKGFSLLALGRDAEVKELLHVNLPANDIGPDFAQWQQLKKESENVNRQIIKRDITMSQFQDVLTVSKALTTKEIFHPHERFPWLNAKVDLRYDAEKGYSLVSKEELKYGEIVALSKPFVSLDPKRDSYERCHYCMVPCFESPKYFSDKANLTNEPKLSSDSFRMVTPLACPECSNVLYCSETCRTAAWTAYHRFECYQMMVLSKIDSKTHLALRMLYMIGSLEVNNLTNAQLIYKFETITDPCALMIDQQAYSFVYSNQAPKGTTFEKSLERTLTISFLLKLVQMSGLLIEPKNSKDREYIGQASKVYTLLLRHLCQGDVNESMPFTYPTTYRTVTPSPFLLVDGMTSLMKHSCEATVASSSILSESFESTVKLLYAMGGIPAGTVLTLAYDTEDRETSERHFIRKNQLCLRYGFDCDCTRCVREERDCLNILSGVYYPIACSVCGELMIRAAGEEGGDSPVLDGSYRCSSSDGCNFTYSTLQMKNIYERVKAMMEAKRSAPLCTHQTYHSFQPKVYQLKTAIESTASLLCDRSILLAQLYTRLACCYLLLTMVPISPGFSGPMSQVDSSTHRLHRDHLTTGLLYSNKVLDILESMKQGPGGIQTQLIGDLAYLFESVVLLQTAIFHEGMVEMILPLGLVRLRYQALQKRTAFDTMVASSLAAKK